MREPRPPDPWHNPVLEEGTYEAVIDDLRETTYGENDDPMVKITFRIPQESTYLTTNIYFPNNYSPASQQRLWFLCQSVGLELQDTTENREAFKGRWLRVKVRQQESMRGESKHQYSDVAMFVPSVARMQEAEECPDPEWHFGCDSWIRPLGEAV